MTSGQAAEVSIRMVREAPLLSYDTETSGLDWKRNVPIGYVFCTSPAEAVYVAIRHGGGGNLPDPDVHSISSPTDKIVIGQYERELASAFRARGQSSRRTIGHHLKFDAHFSANAGVLLGRNLSCTQNNETLLGEYHRSYSLDSSAARHGVTAKKGEELYIHLASMFGGPPTRKSMEHFWKVSGDDPFAVDYAVGDGVSTLELYLSQCRKIEEEGLQRVFELENRLIWTLFRMERRGIKVDEEYLERLLVDIQGRVATAYDRLPTEFNVRSPIAVKNYLESGGRTDWPTTDLGNPSFTEKWLKTFPAGRDIIAVRKWTNLENSFAGPLLEEHSFEGRVHATINQLKADDSGTPARLSCSHPNLQQIPKHNKDLAKLFRRGFVADDGMVFHEADWSQCMAAGTKVTIPGGTKNIEDMKVGDWVYSYDNSRNLVLRKVTWAGQTGVRALNRVYWRTNGRTHGHLDLTADHPVRLVNGTYKTVQQMAESENSGGRGHPYWVPVLALRRGVQTANGYTSSYLWPTGNKRLKESRVLFEQIYGWSPEEVHHKDRDPLNNDPDNLEGVTSAEHRNRHTAFGRDRMTAEERLISSRRATAALRAKRGLTVVNNHAITRIVPLPGEHPVYDITVDDTHNFIANEICVHNCEPRLFAHYSRDPALIAGYAMDPPKDVHGIVSEMLGVERDPTAKRMNMGIFTGMYPKTFAEHMGWPLDRATEAWNSWFELFPTIRKFQEDAKDLLLRRGYVKTLFGRRGRLESPRFAYKATSKIIQGSSADIIKHVMVRLDEWLEAEGDLAHMLMTVHDSFEWQSPDTPEGEQITKEILRVLVDVQTPPLSLRVPFKVDHGFGANWKEATFGAE